MRSTTAASAQAGVKLAKQAYDIMPKMIKGGGDGMYWPEHADRRRLPGGRGLVCDDRLAASDRRHQGRGVHRSIHAAKFNMQPDDYTITAYDAALVIIDAIKRVAASGKPVTRDAVRDAIQTVEGADAAGHGLVRRQRRPGGPHGQRVPDQAGHERASRTTCRRAVPLHRGGAAVLTATLHGRSSDDQLRPAAAADDQRAEPGRDVFACSRSGSPWSTASSN